MRAVLVQAAERIALLELELLAAGDVLDDVTCELAAASPRPGERAAA